jgi:hypothetical protein
MHQGQLVFSQLMRHLPLTTFRRCVARYAGEHKVKSFSCLDQYLCMAFARLTYRESLRDIESSLRAQAAKLYHLGIRGNVSRNTLANANATRDWRIYASFAERLIGIARGLYAEEPFGVDLAETVYALDATTIDLCLSVFPWAPFRSAKAAVKLHTLLDLRGNIPSFIHISDGKMLGGRVLFRWQSRKHVVAVELFGKLLDQTALTDPPPSLHNDERRRFLSRRFNKPAELHLPANKFGHGSPWKCK